MTGVRAFRAVLRNQSMARRAKVVAALLPAELRALDAAWPLWRHKGQAPPRSDWRVWLIQAGRGFGKTRAGAEWVRAAASGEGAADVRIALVAASIEEGRRVMIEGRSGLLALCPRARFDPSRGRVRFESGAAAYLYSASNPESLRGPEHHFAWADELAKWPNAEATWDNLMLGLRLGERPRAIVTTTPQTVPLMKRLHADPGTAMTKGRTGDNPHLPAAFVAAMTAQYAGRALGRQELDGEMIETVEGALWSRATLEAGRVADAPQLRRVVVGVDPPGSSGPQADACGIVVAGLGADGRGYVLADLSVQGASPERWARAVADAADRYGASKVVAEGNGAQALIEQVLAGAGVGLGLRVAHATRSKAARAEPVAALYSSGTVSHVGGFPALEDEMCALMACGRYEGPGRSPDRADALVWALTELMFAPPPRERPRAWIG